MANFYGSARSNYFQVKNAQAFKGWVQTVPGLGLWETDQSQLDGTKTEEERTLLAHNFGIYADDANSGGWPSMIEDEEGGFQDIDLIAALSPHLADGEVAVLVECGAEKLRYICGNAVAFDNTGKVVQVNLDDIYTKAFQAFGVKPNDATY